MSDRSLLILGSVVDKDLTPEPIGGGDLLELFIAAYNPYTDREWTPSPEQREQVQTLCLFGDNTTDEDVVVEFWVRSGTSTLRGSRGCCEPRCCGERAADMRVGSIRRYCYCRR